MLFFWITLETWAFFIRRSRVKRMKKKKQPSPGLDQNATHIPDLLAEQMIVILYLVVKGNEINFVIVGHFENHLKYILYTVIHQ